MKRQRNFTGHVIVKEEIECTVIMGKIEGKKVRRRQRQMMMETADRDG